MPATPDVETQVFRQVVGESSRELARGEHPFGSKRVVMGRDLVIEPTTYLRALLEDFRLAGGVLRIRRFERLRDVAALNPREWNPCANPARARKARHAVLTELLATRQLQPQEFRTADAARSAGAKRQRDPGNERGTAAHWAPPFLIT